MNPDQIFKIIGENQMAKAFVYAATSVLFINWILEMPSKAIHIVAALTIVYYVKMELV